MTADGPLWNGAPFWGLGHEWDPEWTMTARQRELRATVIELCAQEMRRNAERSDDELRFPRRNLELLGEHGFLALTVPERFGGLGADHRTYALVCEAIARYGCPSTAMCFVMHTTAVQTIMLRPTPDLVEDYIVRLGDGLVGTLSYSDPATGGHFWYPLSSSAHEVEGGYRISKKSSWTTSGGFADFYVVQTTSPRFRAYDDLSVFVVDAADVRAQPSMWDALGLRGNQSGSVEIVDAFVPARHRVGPVGDGAESNDEVVDPWFLLGSSAVWNGIALGAIDITKRHVLTKEHRDTGRRVADYPAVQDYVAESLIDTNAARLAVSSVADALDRVTDGNRRVLSPGVRARADRLHWCWQVKFTAAKNVATVVDRMLHACGGSGYRRDLGLERYLRDGKAGWVMGPSNEVVRQFVGRSALLGFDSLDYWSRNVDERVLRHETGKLDAAAKRELARRLLLEADEDEDAGGDSGGDTVDDERGDTRR